MRMILPCKALMGSDAAPSVYDPQSKWHGVKQTKEADADSTESVTVYTDIELPTDQRFVENNDGSPGGEQFPVADFAMHVRPHNDIIESLELQDEGGVSDDPTLNLGEHDKIFATTFNGTYKGEEGVFRCFGETACNPISVTAERGMDSNLQYDDDGNLMLTFGTPSGGNTWHFRPDDQAALAKVDDPDYLYFGWWIDTPTEAGSDGSYTYHFRTFAGDSAMFEATDVNTLEGTASYSGPVVGAWHYVNMFENENFAGRFTAKVGLDVDFGDATAAGTISGKVEDFRNTDPNCQSLDEWSVALAKIVIGGGSRTFMGDASGKID